MIFDEGAMPGRPGIDLIQAQGPLRVPRHLKPEQPEIVLISIVVLTAKSGNHLG
jgi:hypothetical protein